MANDPQDDPEVLETPVVVTDPPADPPEDPEEEDDIETLKEKNKQLFARAKKAEGFEFVDGKWVKANPAPKTPVPSKDEKPLSIKDQAFIVKADIHEDDLDEVLEYATFKGISVKDAHAALKPILDAKAETRKTSETANVQHVRRGPAKVTPESLLEKTRTGALPESDDDINAVVGAKMREK